MQRVRVTIKQAVRAEGDVAANAVVASRHAPHWLGFSVFSLAQRHGVHLGAVTRSRIQNEAGS